MIKANELRIGNLVMWNEEIASIGGVQYLVDIDEGREGWIVDIMRDGLVFQTPNINDINPIPLTPEILEKSGLNENNDEDYVWHDKENNSFHYVVADFGHDGSRFIKVSFLHQLQNLYFALTGEELKIEL